MSRRRSALLIVILSLASLSAIRAERASFSLATGPPLGGAKYTIHAHGSFASVIEQLNRVCPPWRLAEAPADGQPPGGDPAVVNAPVSLDFDNASLKDIVVSICHQAGLVCEVLDGGYHDYYNDYVLYLRPGDIDRDPRPVVELPDDFVRVDEVSARPDEELRQPQGAPGGNTPQKGALYLEFAMVPKTLAAALADPRLSPDLTVITDTSKTLPADGGRGYSDKSPIDPLSPFPRMAYAFLPLPARAAKVLRRIEGGLCLPKRVDISTVRVPPDSVGETLTNGDMKLRVNSWKVEGSTLKAVFAVDVPVPGRDTWKPPFGRDRLAVVLVAKDGSRYPCVAIKTIWSTWPQMIVTCSIPVALYSPNEGRTRPPIPVACVEVTFARRSEEEIVVPFVLENVPLPHPAGARDARLPRIWTWLAVGAALLVCGGTISGLSALRSRLATVCASVLERAPRPSS